MRRKERDPLLGQSRPPGSGALLGSPPPRRGWGDRLALIIHGHLAVAIAALIGWEHLDVIWPTPLLPDGLPIGGEQRIEGLLTVGDPGRPARLASGRDLADDWQTWLRFDQRRDSSECLALPEATRRQLVARGTPRRDAAGAVQYWVRIRVNRRLGPARCDADGGLEINRALAAIDELRPVPCNRDVFVAHGFLCPGERRSPVQQSETFQDIGDYYPYAAVAAEVEGTAKVRVVRDETGSPTACEVLESSGDSSLDRQTCKLIGTDPFFTQAQADTGYADFTKPLTQRVVWRLAD